MQISFYFPPSKSNATDFPCKNNAYRRSLVPNKLNQHKSGRIAQTPKKMERFVNCCSLKYIIDWMMWRHHNRGNFNFLFKLCFSQVSISSLLLCFTFLINVRLNFHQLLKISGSSNSNVLNQVPRNVAGLKKQWTIGHKLFNAFKKLVLFWN